LGRCRGRDPRHRVQPWFDDECSKLIDRRKVAELQWLQNPSQVNGDNMDDVRRETSRTFRTKEREYLKKIIMSLKQTVRIRILEICAGL
jgi:hypothetical protein